ncbi:hypothetical protein EK21DRAFT_106853 [Setomelanomma holmii]|uniref:Uncharacterized protein n=1 Tax=Setomelanomma holmii TaxID=210430 RepID=A0A9P4HM25_9PLEO|nr:hypothetical protein EK21DRAFT_106853 [Setomelanomma holmii]
MDAPGEPPTEAITDRNARKSPLLQLPAEVKNEIYGYVIGGRDINLAGYRTVHHPDIALLVVCRQIYQDTRLLPFALNHGTVTNLLGLKVDCLFLFKDFQRLSIRHVRLEQAWSVVHECLDDMETQGLSFRDILPGVVSVHLDMYEDERAPAFFSSDMSIISDTALLPWRSSRSDWRKLRGFALKKEVMYLKAWMLSDSVGKRPIEVFTTNDRDRKNTLG